MIFFSCITVILAAYWILRLERIEKELMKKVDKFLDRYYDNFDYMAQKLDNDLNQILDKAYLDIKSNFDKIEYQLEQIKRTLHEIRINTDQRDKSEKTITALKAAPAAATKSKTAPQSTAKPRSSASRIKCLYATNTAINAPGKR